MQLGEIIRARRKELNISQVDLAIAIGISPPCLCRIEKGQDNSLGFDAMKELAKAINVPINRLRDARDRPVKLHELRYILTNYPYLSCAIGRAARRIALGQKNPGRLCALITDFLNEGLPPDPIKPFDPKNPVLTYADKNEGDEK